MTDRRSALLAQGALTTAAVMLLLLVHPSAAWAARSGTDYVYAGQGWQYGKWSWNESRLRLVSNPYGDMSTDRCMDAVLDWATYDGHYDSRRVRSCRPGFNIQTDPGGDGYWNEPTSRFQTRVNDMRVGGGVVFDDDDLNVSYHGLNFSGVLQNAAPFNPAPPTCILYARVRTLYQDGHISSCNEAANDPFRSDT